ncbi:MarR family winged helix-turn-helix transcriptional regulator [Nocardioides aequoreus]|uniref:MarR family winged helix-turn-helix transcriptional regulator n=1 Tax=Nocardioides aequoreus TaxID=397278 RepID=UPI0009FC93AF|nr:MarR family winged helix-turn-helix transcriptional regulator [Nocardioides aequoreus]
MSTMQVGREHAVGELVETLLRFHRALKVHGSEWADLAGGLRRGDVVVLGMLHAHGAMRPGHIAARLGCGPSVVSRQLAALTESDLVDRVSDPHDGRAELVSITASGRARLGEVHDALSRRLADRLDGWPADDVRRATQLVDDLVQRLLEPPTSPTTTKDPA